MALVRHALCFLGLGLVGCCLGCSRFGYVLPEDATTDGERGDQRVSNPDGALDSALDAIDASPDPDASPGEVTRPDAVGPVADAAAAVIWATTLTGTEADRVQAVAVDESHNVYVVGEFGGSLQIGPKPAQTHGLRDIFLASFTSGGSYRWSKTFGSTQDDRGLGITTIPSKVCITGSFREEVDFGTTLYSAGADDIFLACYSASDGIFKWAKRFGGLESDKGKSVAYDGDGLLLLVGDLGSNYDFGDGPLNVAGSSDIFIVALDLGGGVIWSRGYGGPGTDYGEDVAATSSLLSKSTIWLAGSVWDSKNSFDIFAASLDRQGNELGSFHPVGDNQDHAYGVAIDDDGNAYLTGDFQGTLTSGQTTLTASGQRDLFVASVDKTGKLRWWNGHGGGGITISTGRDLAHYDGVVTITGGFEGSVTIGNQLLVSESTTKDIFVSRLLAQTGNSIGARGFGSSQPDEGFAVAVDNLQTIIGGFISGPVDFGSGAVPYSNGHDGFVVGLMD